MEQKPVYVKLDEYKNILTTMNTLKTHLSEAKQTLAEVRKLKEEEDVELEIWGSVIQELEKKMEFIETTFIEPEI